MPGDVLFYLGGAKLFYQKEIETMSRKDIEDLQLRKLRWMVDYCYNNVPFYHERLGQAGITSGGKIKTLSDIQYIPCTTKDDIRDNYPFGLLAVPMKKIVRIHASSGTTGKPTVGAYTQGGPRRLERPGRPRCRGRRALRRMIFFKFPLATACSPARWACIMAWKKSAQRSFPPLQATPVSS